MECPLSSGLRAISTRPNSIQSQEIMHSRGGDVPCPPMLVNCCVANIYLDLRGHMLYLHANARLDWQLISGN